MTGEVLHWLRERGMKLLLQKPIVGEKYFYLAITFAIVMCKLLRVICLQQHWTIT